MCPGVEGPEHHGKDLAATVLRERRGGLACPDRLSHVAGPLLAGAHRPGPGGPGGSLGLSTSSRQGRVVPLVGCDGWELEWRTVPRRVGHGRVSPTEWCK